MFELSSGLHDTFCCNINITPKIESETELRTQSKADKHIAKMQGESRLNKPSGYRATFDFKSLNEIITDVGKLSLPTISEVEMSVRNCLVSTMDLKNQFFSIKIEEEDRPKTNFYWQKEVWQHIRQ